MDCRKDVYKRQEQICELLQSSGFAASRYHAGLSPDERRQNQEDFCLLYTSDRREADEQDLAVVARAAADGLQAEAHDAPPVQELPPEDQKAHQLAQRLSLIHI